MPPIERAAFVRALGDEVARARDEASNVGLLLIDLTNLGRINHYHGYRAGDRLLATAYSLLLQLSKLSDTVFRVASHCFAFLLPQLTNPALIALAMNRVTRVLEGGLTVESNMVKVDLKVGYAVNRRGASDPMETLARAESSLAHIKAGGCHRVEDLLADEVEEQVDYLLEQRFTAALQDNEFQLYFQPKVHLVSGQVGSAEALLRWLPEGAAPVSPEVLVELAESTGRSFELTRMVIHRGVRQVKEWHASLGVGLALNVQAGLAGNPDLPALLRDALAIWGVDPGKLTLEITESAFIKDKESGFNNLTSIRELGVRVSIDDFGTGYSSLSYFKYIPAAELKIDKSFVTAMKRDTQDLELVKIMIHIAHQFGLTVVAEGVEDHATVDMLRALGCDYAQGYYFSEPLPAPAFEAWLARWPGRL
jgi:diguanylate cyclase (GGDEF)-like protein